MTGRLTDIIDQSIMLEESRIRQSEILYVDNPEVGVGYQIIAAMHRLGIKCKVPFKSDPARLKPLQVIKAQSQEQDFESASAFLLGFTSDDHQLCLKLGKIPSSAHVVIGLTLQTPHELVLEILETHKNTTLVFYENLFGFRDDHFFDSAMKALRLQKGAHWESLKKQPPFNATFIQDVCGFLISIFWNQNLYGKQLMCPSSLIVPKDFMTGLESHLEFCATPPEKFVAFAKNLFSKHKHQNANEPAPLVGSLSSFTEALNMLDVLPTSSTKTDVFIKKVCEQLEREPDSDLHFPPSRAL